MSKDQVLLPPATIIMTFHKEGVYAHKSLLGFQRIRDYSASHGNQVALICILDNADETTTQIVKNYVSRAGKSDDQVIATQWASSSAARNTAIDHVKTEYVGFCDGDDFFSANRVEHMLKTLLAMQSPILCMPEYVISFGNHTGVQKLIASKDINKTQLINIHPWVCSSFSHISTFVDHPFNEKIGKKNRFAFEDWDFSLRCVDAGIEISPVKDTYMFYRRRENSTLSEHVGFNSFVPPSSFFQNINR